MRTFNNYRIKTHALACHTWFMMLQLNPIYHSINAWQVYLVTRRGTWVFNRIFDYGRPVDCALNTRFFEFFRTVLFMNSTKRKGKVNEKYNVNLAETSSLVHKRSSSMATQSSIRSRTIPSQASPRRIRVLHYFVFPGMNRLYFRYFAFGTLESISST